MGPPPAREHERHEQRNKERSMSGVKTSLAIGGACLLMVLGAGGMSIANSARGRVFAAAPGVQAGQAAPDWTLTDTDGKSVKLSELRGKVVVMDFWATWCVPCKVAMPELERIHNEMGDKGVVVLGMNAWERGDPAKFKKQAGAHYRSTVKADEVAERYGVAAIPTFFVIDPEGKVVMRMDGLVGNWERTIRDAIAMALPKG
ncbi:MAG: hypothetical protein C0513_04160 [Isosphaera sp.]|nr:hypothetical protein [Isosphaera sp.]